MIENYASLRIQLNKTINDKELALNFYKDKTNEQREQIGSLNKK